MALCPPGPAFIISVPFVGCQLIFQSPESTHKQTNKQVTVLILALADIFLASATRDDVRWSTWGVGGVSCDPSWGSAGLAMGVRRRPPGPPPLCGWAPLQQR